MTDKHYRQMYRALLEIKNYASPAQIRRNAERAYGLDPEEALEMAYENVLATAEAGLRGVKRPTEDAAGGN